MQGKHTLVSICQHALIPNNCAGLPPRIYRPSQSTAFCQCLLDIVDQVIDSCHAGLHEAPIQLHDGVPLLDAGLLTHSILKDLRNDHPCGKLALYYAYRADLHQPTHSLNHKQQKYQCCQLSGHHRSVFLSKRGESRRQQGGVMLPNIQSVKTHKLTWPEMIGRKM